MIAGLFLTSEPMKSEAAKTVTLYEENFDGKTIDTLETEGWKNLTQSEVYNDTLKVKNLNTYLNQEKAYSWTNYTFETDFIIGTKNNTVPTDTSYYGIRFGINASGDGVEYRIRQVVDNGTITYQYHVHDRINGHTYANNLSIGDQVLEMDEVMKLKVELADESFTVYLNDVPLNTFTKKYDIVGSIGTRMDSTQVFTYYDNMKVTQEIDPVATEDTMLLETFSSKAKPSYWQAISSTTSHYSTGALRLPDGTSSSAYYLGADSSTPYTWKNYTYSALLTFEVLSETWDGGYKNGITFGRPGLNQDALEYGLAYYPNDGTWWYRVHDRRNSHTVVAGTQVPSNIDINVNEPIEMKVTVEGKNFAVYLNDVLLAIATAKTEIIGTVGISGLSEGIVSFDDIHVVNGDYGTGEKNIISTGDVSSVEEGSKLLTEENNWFADYGDYVVKDGMIKLVAQTKAQYYPMSRYITDGYISADFKIEQPESISNGTYYPAQLTARNTTIYNGDYYETRVRFVSVLGDNGYTNTIQTIIYSGTTTPVVLSLTNWEFDTIYNIRLLCVGNRIETVIKNGAGEVIAEKAYPLEDGNSLIDRAGAFGIQALAGNTFSSYVNNVEVHQFQPYIITDNTDLAEIATVKQSGTVYVTPSKFYVGETVTVNVTGDIAANGLTYVTETDSAVKNIFAQPVGTDKGSGAGNVFVFTMPADNITLRAEAYEGVEDSMASVATSLAEEGDAIRFLNRIYLPDLFAGGFDGTTTVASGDYSGYTIKDCGAIVLPKDWVDAGHKLEIENQYVGKVSMSSTETFKLYDKTTEYLDFTIKITNVKDESRVYSVRTYVTLQKDSETITLYGNTMEQSIGSLKGAY